MSALVPVVPGSSAPRPGSLPPAADGFRLDHVRAVHMNAQDMVRVADQKAQAFVAIGSIAAALLGSNAIDRFRSTAERTASHALLWFGVLTLVVFVAAVFCAVAVLQPRFPAVRRPTGAPGLFWANDVAEYQANPDEYVGALLGITDAGALADVAYENVKISVLLAEKWKWSRRATSFLRGGLVAWAVTVILAVVGG